MTKIYCRDSRELRNTLDYRSGWLQSLYATPWGRSLLPLVTAKWFAKAMTWQDYTPWSKHKIKYFIDHYNIKAEELEMTSYANFAQFFQRKFKAGIRTACLPGEVMAVADAKLLVLPISADQTLDIKGQVYRFADLVQDKVISSYFEGGLAFIYRLGVEDYHRYWASETGSVIQQKVIKGKLHSVRDIAQARHLVFKENQREYSLIKTTNLGIVMQMEIGALTVGKIHNKQTTQLQRGQEKGWFSLGGSTIIVAYQHHRVTVDGDILQYSQQGIETQVKMGERVGVKDDQEISDIF